MAVPPPAPPPPRPRPLPLIAVQPACPPSFGGQARRGRTARSWPGGPPFFCGKGGRRMSIDVAYPPRLADGVELLGELKNSGFTKPPALVRRADGQMIQLSRLLYLVACQIDGTRAPGAIAALVSDDLGRELNADQVSYLISDKLAPLGVIAGQDTPAALPKARPLLALRAQGTLLP